MPAMQVEAGAHLSQQENLSNMNLLCLGQRFGASACVRPSSISPLRECMAELCKCVPRRTGIRKGRY